MTTQVYQAGPQAASTLRNYISNALTTRQFVNNLSQYLRPSDIDNLASQVNVRSIVGSEKAITFDQITPLVNGIERKGRRMFIICVAANIPMKYLRIFLSHGATDAELPFAHNKFNQHTQDVRNHARAFNKFQYLVPRVLNGGDFSAKYSSAGVPIVSGSLLGFGVSGDVYRARLDTGYCNISGVKVDSRQAGLTKEVAIKAFKSKTGAQQDHADREVSFARILSTDRPHPHITTSYASLKVHTENRIGETLYIISELAKCSLEALMLGEDPKPAMMVQTEHWMREQIRGLASALALIHESKDGLTGVHHDIKPDNILLFQNETLKFTDWGCASFRASDYTPASSPKTGARGQFPYLPPEHLNLRPTGRPHDVWALGCVFTEMLVWLTEGKDSHRTFAKDVYKNQPKHECWFVGQIGSLELSQVLKDKLDLLQTGTWSNLVSIIRKMFIIDPQNRITAQDLVTDLNDPQNQI